MIFPRVKEKKQILCFLILSFLFLNTSELHSQSGWFWQHPYPQGDFIQDNYFINKNTGWAITEHQILKTTNGGINWSINSNSDWQFESVFFIDENTGWAGGIRNLYKSTNGGINWTTLTITYYGDYLFKDIVFLNSQTGLTLTADAIYKTTNGGMNWSLKMQNTYDHLSSFSFINELTGWVSSDSGKIYKTTNSGNNWFKQASGFNVTLNKVKFVDSLNGFACGQNSAFLKSTNGGNNWQISTVGAFSNLLNCEFYNENTGWVTYSKTWETGVICKTTNGGAQWDTTSTINALYNISMLDSANLFATGYGIVRTSNGENWNQVSHGRTNWLYSSSFINENTGWTAGGNVYSNYFSLLLKTTNGGTDWIEFPNFSTTPIRSIYFINENTGWAAGDYGKLLKSTNGGYNWQNIVTPTSIIITNIYFSDTLKGWMTCGDLNSAAIFSTTNGGLNWYSQFSANGYDMNTLCFINSLTGFAGGGNNQGLGKVFKTTNGGVNWTAQVNLSHEIFAIKFINNNTGWAAGGDSYGNIYKTTNGGVIWTEQNLPPSSAINSIEFINENIGWVGSSALIYTSNGGTNWVYENTGSKVVIYSLHFANANTGWIFGSWGSILKTTNGGHVFVNNNSTSTPNDYCLMQNYPNPFNPLTTIEYSVPKSGRVVIKVFDIAGREIRTVQDVFRQAGNYRVVFDGTGLASGVYFYRMEADDFVKTEKMVLLK